MIRLVLIDVGTRFRELGESAGTVNTEAELRDAIAGDPCVAVWHCTHGLEAALKLLSGFAPWPAHLLGVVLFRGGPFAEAGSKERADQLLSDSKLDKQKVFIWPSVVPNTGTKKLGEMRSRVVRLQSKLREIDPSVEEARGEVRAALDLLKDPDGDAYVAAACAAELLRQSGAIDDCEFDAAVNWQAARDNGFRPDLNRQELVAWLAARCMRKSGVLGAVQSCQHSVQRVKEAIPKALELTPVLLEILQRADEKVSRLLDVSVEKDAAEIVEWLPIQLSPKSRVSLKSEVSKALVSTEPLLGQRHIWQPLGESYRSALSEIRDQGRLSAIRDKLKRAAEKLEKVLHDTALR